MRVRSLIVLVGVSLGTPPPLAWADPPPVACWRVDATDASGSYTLVCPNGYHITIHPDGTTSQGNGFLDPIQQRPVRRPIPLDRGPRS